MKNAKVISILKYTVYGLIWAVIVCALASVIAGKRNASIGGIRLFVVQSGSMEKTIHKGAVVVTKAQSAYHPKDIVTFTDSQRGATPITHRIVDVRSVGGQERFMTKGDANHAPDPDDLDPKNIIGRVLFSVPLVGYLLAAVKTPVGFILVIVIPAIAFIVDEVYQLVLDRKKSA